MPELRVASGRDCSEIQALANPKASFGVEDKYSCIQTQLQLASGNGKENIYSRAYDSFGVNTSNKAEHFLANMDSHNNNSQYYPQYQQYNRNQHSNYNTAAVSVPYQQQYQQQGANVSQFNARSGLQVFNSYLQNQQQNVFNGPTISVKAEPNENSNASSQHAHAVGMQPNSLYGTRQISFDKSQYTDRDLWSYLELPGIDPGQYFLSEPSTYPKQNEANSVSLRNNFYTHSNSSSSATEPKAIASTVVVPQKNVKYYGLCEHKNNKRNCKICALKNDAKLSGSKTDSDKLDLKSRSKIGVKRGVPGSGTGVGNEVGSHLASKRRRPMQFWTKHEDILLCKAIEQYGTRKWMQIAKSVPGKDHKQCLQRWNKVLNPKLKKGRWTEEEDEFLLQLVQDQTELNESGHNKNIKWNVISEAMQDSRSAKQCRERWVNHLNPAVTKNAWHPEEDKTLLALHEKFPNKWANISRCLPGRSESMVKSRLTKLTKYQKKKSKQLSGAVSTIDHLEQPPATTGSVKVDGSSSAALSKTKRANQKKIHAEATEQLLQSNTADVNVSNNHLLSLLDEDSALIDEEDVRGGEVRSSHADTIAGAPTDCSEAG